MLTRPLLQSGCAILLFCVLKVICLVMVCFLTYFIFQIADVAQAVVNAIHEDDSIGQTFELVG